MKEMHHNCKKVEKEVWIDLYEACPHGCGWMAIPYDIPPTKEEIIEENKEHQLYKYLEINAVFPKDDKPESLSGFDEDGHSIAAGDTYEIAEWPYPVIVKILRGAPKEECILMVKKILDWMENDEHNFLWGNWEMNLYENEEEKISK